MCGSVDADSPVSEGLKVRLNSGFEGRLSEMQPGVTIKGHRRRDGTRE